MLRNALPNFIHAGVPKSASATINEMLRSHPAVFLPRQKEPSFFNTDDRFSQGLGWYSTTYFADVANEKIIGDMSIGYATGFGFDAPARIAEALGTDLKILLTFREPVARAHSQYRMSHNKGQLEQLSFAEAIDRALAAGPKITDADRLRARTGSYYSSKADMDAFRWCMYIEPGRYADILETWAGVFGIENVLVLLTDDISADFQSQADRLFDFLGIDSMPVEPEMRSNVATTLRYPVMRRVLNRLYAIGPLRRALNTPRMDRQRDWLRRRLLSRNYVENMVSESPDHETVVRLSDYYEAQIARLEKMLARDLSMWRRK
ncbi:MAG: sulfotransferase domain-containing protein [Parasphingorhabdus sp.]